MGIVIQIIGILIILISLILTARWIVADKSSKKYIITLCFIAIFAGVIMIFNPRITKLTFPKIGTIEVAVEQATLDAKLIREIKQRTEAQSATIDLVAKQAVETKKLSEELQYKNELAEKKLSSIDEELQKASKLVSDLELTRAFTLTVIAAQNDDRKSLDQLETWGKDKSYPLSSQAEQAWSNIASQIYNVIILDYQIPWDTNYHITDPSKLTFDNLRKLYEGAPLHSNYRIGIMQYILKRPDITKEAKMQFLVDVIKGETSIRITYYAVKYFVEEAKIPSYVEKVGYVDELLSWWKQNKDKY